MTEEEKQRRHEAEMAHIYASIDQMRATVEQMRIQNDKIQAETAKLIGAELLESRAISAKLHAETKKIGTEDRWYLLVVGSGATLAIVAIAKLFL